MDEPEDEWLDYHGLMARFGLSKSAVYRLKQAGTITWRKVPGLGTRFSRRSVERLLENCTHKGRERPPERPEPVTRRPPPKAILPPEFQRHF